MYCRYCGTDIGDNDAFCLNCGKPTGEPAIEVNEPEKGRNYNSNTVDINDVADEVEQQLIGKNLEYYIPKFASIRCFGQKVQWNWAAFFLGPLWFLYRKMYKWAIALMAINTVFVAAYGGFFSAVIVGMLGNMMYSGHIKNLGNQARCMDNPIDRDSFISRKGGTSWTGVIVLIVLEIILIALFICLMWAVYNAGY